MKFKDKDGNVFDGVVAFRGNFCCDYGTDDFGNCVECPIWQAGKTKFCEEWISDHPAEAARLMGYEVVEDESEKGCHNCGRFPKDSPPCGYADDCCTPPNDPPSAPSHWTPRKETNMDKQKPRICEVLGVEVGQTFTAKTPFGNPNRCEISEDGMFLNAGTNIVCYIINNPDCILRQPRFTEEEVAAARVLQAGGIVEVERGDYSDGDLHAYSRRSESGPRRCWNIPHELFPSLAKNTSVQLAEIVGGSP